MHTKTHIMFYIQIYNFDTELDKLLKVFDWADRQI